MTEDRPLTNDSPFLALALTGAAVLIGVAAIGFMLYLASEGEVEEGFAVFAQLLVSALVVAGLASITKSLYILRVDALNRDARRRGSAESLPNHVS